MIARRRFVRRLAGAIVASVCGARAARSAPAGEGDFHEDFKIFLNVKEQLVEQCIYQPTEMKVLSGALNALQRELDAELAPYFPERLHRDFQKAFDQYQIAIRNIAKQKEAGGRTVKQLIEQSLRAYCRTLDRYSDYDDIATFEREQALKKSDYSGVGMTLERTLEGFDLYPFPGGPADLAGCFSGDRLVAVNGKAVRGLNAVDVAAMIAGPAGETVRLSVRHRHGGSEETVAVERGKIMSSFISVEQGSKGISVRLRKITAETLEDLRKFLRTAKPGEPLTMDLRGCPGGELVPSIGIAELFIPAGALICRVEMRTGKDEFRSKNTRPFRARPLVILHDKGTMSGAELITVALATAPAVRAETRGERTFGKGVTLSDVLVDNGGGRVRFADGRMYGPNGEFWDGEGLSPAVEELRPK